MLSKVQIMVTQGSALTIELTLCSLFFGTILGIILALLKISKMKVLNIFATIYIWIFRGTPLLLQLFFFYYALPLINPHLKMSGFIAAVIGLSFNCGAYMSEIIRGGILAIDKGQFEASKALGFSYVQTMWKIVLPQTFRVIIPPVGNEFISMLKDTSLVSTMALLEIMKTAGNIGSASFKVPEMLTLAALFYLLLTTLFTIGFSFVEKKLSRYA